MSEIERKNIILLGSTGSVGTQALKVARHLGLGVTALAAGSRLDVLEAQIREFRPALAAVATEEMARQLRVAVADCPVKILSGPEGLCACAAAEGADSVLNAVVGMLGLRPTLAALEAGKNVALANKETLVAGGRFVTEAAKRRGCKILPVDSEHSAVFQCLQGVPDFRQVRKLILTASGGPFFHKTKEELKSVTAAEALRHPTWNMGAKITVDSASLMNKGLEVIEAVHLFDMPEDRIDVVVHRESIIHSMVEFEDGSVLAQMGVPDMAGPIQYALTYPDRVPSPVRPLNLAEIGKLTFFEPDNERFPLLDVCRRAVREGDLKPAAVNGANEAAVDLFLKGTISFEALHELVAEAMERQPSHPARDLEDVYEADRKAREFVTQKGRK